MLPARLHSPQHTGEKMNSIPPPGILASQKFIDIRWKFDPESFEETAESIQATVDQCIVEGLDQGIFKVGAEDRAYITDILSCVVLGIKERGESSHSAPPLTITLTFGPLCSL